MITENKLREIIFRAAEMWRAKNKELLSCFNAEKLFEAIHAFNDLEPDEDFGTVLKTKIAYGQPNRRNVMATVISEDSNEVELIEQGIELSFDKAFLTLFDRGALNKLFVVEDVPASAQRDIDRMTARVEAAKPAVAQVVAPPPPPDPVATCVKDFHEMGSTAFQRKYMSDTRNRKFYEAAISAGRI